MSRDPVSTAYDNLRECEIEVVIGPFADEWEAVDYAAEWRTTLNDKLDFYDAAVVCSRGRNVVITDVRAVKGRTVGGRKR